MTLASMRMFRAVPPLVRRVRRSFRIVALLAFYALLSPGVAGAQSAGGAGICERTPAVRDALIGALGGARPCAEVTDAELATVTRLVVSGKGLTALKADDLDGLTGLRTLGLYDNQLTALPELSRLTALEWLYAYDNRLTALPELSALTALEGLVVNDNRLTALPDLSALTALGWLGVDDNPLSTLSALALTDTDGNAIALTPVFAGGTLGYTARTGAAGVKVRPTSSRGGSQVNSYS